MVLVCKNFNLLHPRIWLIKVQCSAEEVDAEEVENVKSLQTDRWQMKGDLKESLELSCLHSC